MASKLRAKSPEETNPGHIKMLIYGPPGVGKTWLGMDFPEPYYIDTEGGARLAHYQAKLKASGGVYMGVESGALDFPTLIEEVKLLATEKHGYRTLVIDSLTKVYQTAIAIESERLGSLDQFGASKKAGISAMRQLIRWIMRLDMNVVFIAHETSEWGKNEKTGQREEIGKMADTWEKLPFELDLALQAIKQGSTRYAVVTKTRLTGFPDRERFPLSYAEFATRYGKDFIEAEAKPIVLATPEQVAEIERLMRVVKVDESTVEKWNKKAGADTFAEYSTEHAAGVISFLTKSVTP